MPTKDWYKCELTKLLNYAAFGFTETRDNLYKLLEQAARDPEFKLRPEVGIYEISEFLSISLHRAREIVSKHKENKIKIVNKDDKFPKVDRESLIRYRNRQLRKQRKALTEITKLNENLYIEKGV